MLASLLRRRYASTSLRICKFSSSCKIHSPAPQPLRILFCGSDEFSCVSLRALHAEHIANPALIQSIDVLCRPGKPTGRGLKIITEPKIKDEAERLKLPLHQRDTFTGWSIPKERHINLLVAVSFGLFVPRRILQSISYGGLNVHPSLLPDLRGPAPLQHALLNLDKMTGVTLQTLDTEAFDCGRILSQKSFSTGLTSNPETANLALLLQRAADDAAALLMTGLREGVYLPGPTPGVLNRAGPELRHAPKITNADREIDLRESSAAQIIVKDRVIGRLRIFLKERSTGKLKQVILSGISVASPSTEAVATSIPLHLHDQNRECYACHAWDAGDGKLGLSGPGDASSASITSIIVNRLLVEGEKERPAWSVISPQGRPASMSDGPECKNIESPDHSKAIASCRWTTG